MMNFSLDKFAQLYVQADRPSGKRNPAGELCFAAATFLGVTIALTIIAIN